MTTFVKNVALFALCLLTSQGRLSAGYWWSGPPPLPSGTMQKSTPISTSGSSPVTYSTWTMTSASVAGDGGSCSTSAYVFINTYGTWTGTYDYSTPSATASFSRTINRQHDGSPSHVGVQGIYRASWKVRVSFKATCSVTSIAEARCGGAASASGSTVGVTEEVSIDGISVGCTTSGSYPIGFTAGGSYAGTGLTVGFHGSTNSTSIYNSGLQFREYTAMTPEKETTFPTLSLLYSGSTSASVAGSATPGFVNSSQAQAYLRTEATVLDATLLIQCPPPPPPPPGGG
jgi:hypothetical protein